MFKIKVILISKKIFQIIQKNTPKKKVHPFNTNNPSKIKENRMKMYQRRSQRITVPKRNPKTYRLPRIRSKKRLKKRTKNMIKNSMMQPEKSKWFIKKSNNSKKKTRKKEAKIQ